MPRLTSAQRTWTDRMRRQRAADQALNPRPPSVFSSLRHTCHRCGAFSDTTDLVAMPDPLEPGTVWFLHRKPCSSF